MYAGSRFVILSNSSWENSMTTEPTTLFNRLCQGIYKALCDEMKLRCTAGSAGLHSMSFDMNTPIDVPRLVEVLRKVIESLGMDFHARHDINNAVGCAIWLRNELVVTLTITYNLSELFCTISPHRPF